MMLNNNKKIFGNSNSENIILKGSSFSGSVTTEGSIKIMGEVTGSNLKADKIYIKPEAKVKVNLEVNTLFVEGLYIGDARAEMRVLLLPNSKVLGNITTKEMVTSEGVLFQGNCKVSNESLNDIGKHIQDIFNDRVKSE